jgi:hypothetical protein
MKPPVFENVRADSVDGTLEAVERYGSDAKGLDAITAHDARRGQIA